MNSIFHDYQVEDRGGQLVLELKCDAFRFPSDAWVNELIGGLHRRGKLRFRDLPHHDLTDQPITMDDFTVIKNPRQYVVKLPTWTGVRTLASEISQAKIYQYVTVAVDDDLPLMFDTYERSLELAELAASFMGSVLPCGLVAAVAPAGMHAACRSFKQIVEDTERDQTNAPGVKRPQVL